MRIFCQTCINLTSDYPLKMDEQSVEETCPDLNAAEAAEDLDGDHLTKPDDESCAAEVEVEETGQAATEEDEANVQNAEDEPEEELGASVIDDLPVCDDFEEDDTSDVEIFPNENEEEEEEPESQVEEDHRQPSADLQDNLKVDSADEQNLLRELQTEHEKLSQLNSQLQAKLAAFFWLKSGGKLQSVQEKIPDAVGAGEKYLDVIEDIKKQRHDKMQYHLQRHHVDDLERQNKEKLEQIERDWSMLVLAMHKVVLAELEQEMSKMKAQAVAERLLTAAQKCKDEFLSVRLENFKLNLRLLKLEAGLHVSEEDGEMSHIELEQMKVEHQSNREKIQEYTKDLLKLKRTLPLIEQIPLHVKEKLWFVQVEKQTKQVRFDELDALVLHEQEALMQTMQARDMLRFDNLRKRQDCGLLGNSTLLRDLEDTEDQREALERKVEKLKRHTDTFTTTSTCSTPTEAQ